MQLRLQPRKPALQPGEALCGFRTSKAYLWGLVRDRLAELQGRRSQPLLVLDAACHALITRAMFPKGCLYHGLDVAHGRLEQALSRSAPNDRLYWADLTRPLPLRQAFEAVVSLNTFSHLPVGDQPQAISNLVEACRIGGDLLINAGIDAQLMPLTEALLGGFKEVEPIYFDSFLSEAQEEAGSIHAGNVLERLGPNEVALPNDACLHRQVLLHARSRQGQPKPQQPPRTKNPAKILRLNDVPLLQRRDFADDDALLANADLWASAPSVAFTPALAEAAIGQALRRKLEGRGLTCRVLDSGLQPQDTLPHLVVLGLEQPWSPGTASDRLAINRLRRTTGLLLTFALVASRDGKRCKPSLVGSDL
jgi:hypothetical protein